MIYCKKCGSEVPTGDVCPKCGTIIEDEVIIDDAAVSEIPEKNPGKTMGLISLILGIASVGGYCCSCVPIIGYITYALPIIAIVGLILAIVGMNKSKKAGFKNTLAIVGLIISIVGIIVALINVVLSVLLGGAYLVAMIASLAGSSY